MERHPEPVISSVDCTDEYLNVRLEDGRVISVPLWWYPRLLGASVDERATWELHPGGVGIHWPLVDEDLSVRGLLKGVPAPGARPPAKAG